MPEQFSHCSYCGARYQPDQPWPRVCSTCNNITFRNPLPVVVTLVPCLQGVLLVRRAIPPRLGQLALPGGYIDYGESWQQAAAREVNEETGLLLNPADIQVFAVRSAPDSTLIIVGIAPLQADPPLAFTSDEVSEIVFARQPVELAFPLHTEALQRYLTQIQGAIDHVTH